MKNRGKLKRMDVRKIVPKTAVKGAVPGTISYVGKPRNEQIKFDIVEYDESGITEHTADTLSKLTDVIASPAKKWIKVTGVHDADLLKDIGNYFSINHLDLEDIANTTQRPRIEERDNYIFIVMKLLQLDSETGDVVIEQVSILMGKKWVISFHETELQPFDILRQRILSGKGRIMKMQTDYLAFAIADVVRDQYFNLIDDIGETIEDTDERLILEPDRSSQESIYRLKRRLVYVKKSIAPVREVVNTLQRSEHPLIHDETRIYFRNIYDHTIQVIETIESLRDITSGMMDLYLSTVSNRMNEIMKVLTIFSAVFIPLTFLAGVYGMNFKYLPETGWHWGYFAFWGVCIILALFMLVIFKRRKWL